MKCFDQAWRGFEDEGCGAVRDGQSEIAQELGEFETGTGGPPQATTVLLFSQQQTDVVFEAEMSGNQRLDQVSFVAAEPASIGTCQKQWATCPHDPVSEQGLRSNRYAFALRKLGQRAKNEWR